MALEPQRPYRPRGQDARLIAEGNSDKVVRLERGASDEAAVDIFHCEQFSGIRGLAAASVEDSSLLSSLFAELAGKHLADVGVDFLGLLGGSGLARSDSPYS